MSEVSVFPEEFGREDVDPILLEGKAEDGKYLMRHRAGYPGDYVLAVIFKGRPTHHLVSKDAATGHFMINKRGYGKLSAIEEVVALFSKPNVPNWPVLLGQGVKYEGQLPKAKTTEAPPPATTATPTSAPPPSEPQPSSAQPEPTPVVTSTPNSQDEDEQRKKKEEEEAAARKREQEEQERRRREEDERRQREEEDRRRQEEQARQAAASREEEERRRKEEDERRRKEAERQEAERAEAARRASEEAARRAEETRKADEARRAEEARKADEAKRAEEMRRAEESKRLQEEEARQKAQEAKRQLDYAMGYDSPPKAFATLPRSPQQIQVAPTSNGNGAPTSNEELNKTLAKAVIKLSQRVGILEQKVMELERRSTNLNLEKNSAL